MRVVELEEFASSTQFSADLDPIFVDYAKIDKDFCCRLSSMDWEDRSIFFKLLTDSFTYKNLNTYQSDEESSCGSDDEN
jgi:hypothetical protein